MQGEQAPEAVENGTTGTHGHTTCQRIVSMNIPDLGVYGLPQMKCGAPIPRPACPFGNDRHSGCPYLAVSS